MNLRPTINNPQTGRKNPATRRVLDPNAGEFISWEEVETGRALITQDKVLDLVTTSGKAAAKGLVVAGYWGAVGAGWLVVQIARGLWAVSAWIGRGIVARLESPREDYDWSSFRGNTATGSIEIETNVHVPQGVNVHVVTNVKTL